MPILDNLQPIIRTKALQLKEVVKLKHGIDIIFTSGYRDPKEQEKIYNQGRDEKGNIIDKSKVVTYAKPFLSFHNYGLAVDLVPIKDSKVWWEAPFSIWEKIGIEAELLGFTWGGRWTGKKQDKPHIEYHPGLTIQEIKDYFLKTGKVLIEKALNPVLVLTIGIGVFF